MCATQLAQFQNQKHVLIKLEFIKPKIEIQMIFLFFTTIINLLFYRTFFKKNFLFCVGLLAS